MAIPRSSSKILIVGCGDIGTPLGIQLSNEGDEVWGLRRSSRLPAPLHTLHADVTNAESLRPLRKNDFAYVVVTLTPGGFSDDHYRRVFVEGLGNVLAALNRSALKHLLFVSSTSVYHQTDGGWVDEDTPVHPPTFSGKRLLEAEQLLADSGLSYSVIRFAGIYGPGRRRLIEQVRAGKGCAERPPLYTNRIHSHDCVGFLKFLLHLHQQGESLEDCYIGVDSTPVTMWAIKTWMASTMGIDPQSLSAEQTSRRNSKRCSNRRLLASGYQLQYPDFRDGYRSLIAGENR